MEPEHLEPDELEHELNIRGLPLQVTRLRARNLRERLLMEMRKEVLAPVVCLNPDLGLEMTIVDGKLKQLDFDMVNAAESNCFKSMEILSSRLYHLYGRLVRIRSDDQRINKHQCTLNKKLNSYIEVIHLALEGKVVMKDQLKTLNLSSISSSTRNEARALTPIPSLAQNPAPRSTLQEGRDLSPIPESFNPVKVTSILQRNVPNEPSPRSNAGEGLSARLDALELSGDCDDEVSDILLNNIDVWKYGAMPKRIISPVSSFRNNRNSDQIPRLPQVDLNEAFFPARNTRRDSNALGGDFNTDVTAPLNTARNIRAPIPLNRPMPVPVERPPPVAVEVEERRKFRNRNPILNWQLVFTGVQGKGLSISDFLTQVTLMARADSVSERELFLSAIHLFTGSARNWYVAFEKYYDNWQQLVHALKEQFLPHESDLYLLREAESRKQRSDEAFVLFLSSMMNLFDHLQIPLPEARKLSIVMRNMLPYLRQALALTEVVDFNALVRLCRKLESIRATTVPQNVVSEVTKESSNRGENFCHNCQETGHLFPECKHPKIRVFCYRCGELGQLATTCTKCRQVQGNLPSRPSYPNYPARGGR